MGKIMSNLKYKLPIFSEIDHLQLDESQLTTLIETTLGLEKDFQSVLEANKKLCGFNHDLTQAVYDNFFQISLTESPFNKQDISLSECEESGKLLNEGKKVTSVKRKKILSIEPGNPLNESEYGEKTVYYNNYKALFDGILAKFKGVPTRVRLVKLESNTSIAPHIDYDPSYAVRIIIPIIADENCINVFWAKNKIESVTFKPGKAYFLNTGFKHAVMNFSKRDRYTFMVSVKGIEDIEHLIIK